MIYTFDTNVFVSLQHKYKDKYFKEIWIFLENLMKTKEILISREVVVELEIHVYLSDAVYENLDSFNLVNKSNTIREMLERYVDYLDKNGINKDEIKKQKRSKQREICMIPSQITKYNNIAKKYQFKNLSELIYNAYLHSKNEN